MLYVNDEWPEKIVHEMGHFVNDYLKMYSSLPENRELYRNECSKISYYAEVNEREFFAEAFRPLMNFYAKGKILPAVIKMSVPEQE